MAFQTSTTWRKPTRPKPERKAMNRTGEKGSWWIFVSAVLNRFFLRIAMPQRCELCDGTSYCGPIQPAHRKRRQDIRKFNWEEAFRVAVLGNDCHYEIDVKGRRAAEPIIENIIATRFKRMGLSEEKVKELLLECAKEVQAENEKFSEYVVVL